MINARLLCTHRFDIEQCGMQHILQMEHKYAWHAAVRTHRRHGTLQVSCPHWGRLDFSCGWQAFAAGAGAAAVSAALVAFRPDAVLGVDWHAALALQAAAGQAAVKGARRLNATPFVYLNYRCVLALRLIIMLYHAAL